MCCCCSVGPEGMTVCYCCSIGPEGVTDCVVVVAALDLRE